MDTKSRNIIERVVLPPSPNWFNANSTTVSEDGTKFAYAAQQNIVVMNTKDLQVIKILHGHTRNVTSLCFCGNEVVCSTGQDKTIRTWNVDSGTQTRVLYRQQAGMISIAYFPKYYPFNPTSNDLCSSDEVAIGDDHGGIKTWAINSKEKPVIIMSSLGSAVTSLITIPVSGDDKMVVAGCQNGRLAFINVAARSIAKDLAGHVASIRSLECLCLDVQSNRDHVSLSIDTSRTDTIGRVEIYLGVSERANRYILVSGDLRIQNADEQGNTVLVLGSIDGQLNVWNPADGSLVASTLFPKIKKKSKQMGHPWIATSLFLSDSPSTIWIVSSMFSRCRAWSLRFNRETYGTFHFSFISQKLRLVEVERLSEPLNLPDWHKRVVFTSDKIPSAESFRWITTTMDRYINLITCPLDGKWTQSKIHCSFNCFGGEITSLSASSSSLAVSCADKTIRIVSLSKPISPSTSKPRWQGIKARVTCVQWHPVSSVLAFGCWDGAVGVLKEDGPESYTYAFRHKKPVVCLQWRLSGTSGKALRLSEFSSFAVEGGAFGEYELISLGKEGCLLLWPQIYESEWKGKDFKKQPSSESKPSVHDSNPTNIRDIMDDLGIESRPTSFCVEPNGSKVYLGEEGGWVSSFESPQKLQDLKLAERVKATNSSIEYVESSFDRVLVLSHETVKVVRFPCEQQDMSHLNCIDVVCAHWHPRLGDRILAMHKDKKIKVWDTSSSSAPLMEIESVFSDKMISFVVHSQSQETIYVAHQHQILTAIHLPDLPRDDVRPAPSSPHKSMEIAVLGKRHQMDHKQHDSAPSKLQRTEDEPSISPEGQKMEVKPDEETVPLLPDLKQEPKITTHRTGKRKMSSLRNRPLSYYKRATPDTSLLGSLISSASSDDPISLERSTDLWTSLEPWGLFPTPSKAASSLYEELDAVRQSQDLDHKTVESVALRFLWMDKFEDAAEVLFKNNSMSGEFLPFFVPAGRHFYERVIQKYIAHLEANNEAHLAAMHKLALGDTEGAIDSYIDCKMHDDAICLCGLKYLRQDGRSKRIFSHRGRSKKSAHSNPAIANAMDLIIGENHAEALQVVDRDELVGLIYELQVLYACRPEEEAVALSKILPSLCRKVDRAQVDTEKTVGLLRHILVELINDSAPEDGIGDVRETILDLKGGRVQSGEVLYADVLSELLNGHFSKFLFDVKHDAGGNIFEAGLVCFQSFKRCWELCLEAERPSLERALDTCTEMSSFAKSKEASKQALALCECFLHRLHGLEANYLTKIQVLKEMVSCDKMDSESMEEGEIP